MLTYVMKKLLLKNQLSRIDKLNLIDNAILNYLLNHHNLSSVVL